MRVLRIYHAGRDAAHRERERALVRAGVEVTLVVPTRWPGPDDVHDEPFEIVELPVRRAGDVNRHVYDDPRALAALIERWKPDVLDLHEEPFSEVAHQVLRRLYSHERVVGYTAQNIDKRFPPPYAIWERQALARLDGLYPCSRQAASVAVGKGFRGPVSVLPLAPSAHMTPGEQQAPAGELNLLLVGRLVPEKGVTDAVEVLAATRHLGARLRIVGEGPEAPRAKGLAERLGVSDRLELLPWLDAAALAACYQWAHVLLAPSRATRTWVEQFGRTVVEAQACGAVVVAYASGSLPEVVGEAGLLVAEGDSRALARAIERLALDPQEWLRVRQAGLAAAERTTWDAVARGQAELYEQAVAATPQRTARTQRTAARSEWGEPARARGPERPVAVPPLRDHDALNRATGAVIDGLSRRDRSRPVSKRPKVVYLDHVARMSGGEIALTRLLSALDGEVDAHVILAEEGPLQQALEQTGASVEVLPMSGHARDLRRTSVTSGAGAAAALSTVAYTLRLARRLRELQPDLVHTNSMKSGYYGSVAARLANTPVLWHVRDRIADDYLPGPVVQLTRAALQVLPTAVIANSQATLETTGERVARGGFRGVVNSVVRDPLAAPEYEQPEGLPGLRVAIVGRIAPWKGQDVFLRAFAELAADFPELGGYIVGSAMFGEDAYEASLRSLSTELGLDDRVTFTGHVDDVASRLQRLTVLVHASTTPEPFGQVIVEGLAAGVPVVATRGGGPSEIITHGHDGLLVAPGDPHALAAAVRRLLDDEELRERIRQHGLERAADFSPTRIGAQMSAIYAAILGR